MDCVFCKIVKREIPASIEKETPNVIAFKSINPASSVHVLLTPKKHIENFMVLKSKYKDLLFEMVQVAQELIKEKRSEKGYKMIFNGGRFQTIPHIHWHLLAGNLNDDYYKKI